MRNKEITLKSALISFFLRTYIIICVLLTILFACLFGVTLIFSLAEQRAVSRSFCEMYYDVGYSLSDLDYKVLIYDNVTNKVIDSNMQDTRLAIERINEHQEIDNLLYSIHQYNEFVLYMEYDINVLLEQYAKLGLVTILLAVLVCIIGFNSIRNFYENCVLEPIEVITSNLYKYTATLGSKKLTLEDYVELESDNRFVEYSNIQAAIRLLLKTLISTQSELADTQYESEHDELTNLFNRTRFHDDVALLANKAEKKLGVIFFDLNGLKSMNDSRGHEFGDILIMRTATIFKTAFSDKRCKIYRYGGDEFIIFILDSDADEVDRFIRDWKHCCEKVNKSSDIQVSCAYGSACGYAKDVQNLITEADEKMYACKKAMKVER